MGCCATGGPEVVRAHLDGLACRRRCASPRSQFGGRAEAGRSMISLEQRGCRPCVTNPPHCIAERNRDFTAALARARCQQGANTPRTSRPGGRFRRGRAFPTGANRHAGPHETSTAGVGDPRLGPDHLPRRESYPPGDWLIDVDPDFLLQVFGEEVRPCRGVGRDGAGRVTRGGT